MLPVLKSQARELARHGYLSGMAAVYRMTGQMAALARPRVQILHLHEIASSQENRFRALLKLLAQEHDFISFSEAITRIAENRIDRPYLSLTWDDGLRDCLRTAEILEEFGARGCYFVCTAIAGERDAAKIAWFCRTRLHREPTEFLNWNEIEQLLARGHEIGSHTMTHPNLAEVSQTEMQDEIGASRAELLRRTGRAEHFAWPYGRFFHFTPEAAQTVFEAGYQTCVSGERGCHILPPYNGLQNLCVRRGHTMTEWPQHHILYLLAHASRAASALDNDWPTAWAVQT